MRVNQVPWARVGAEFLAILAGVTLALLADDWRDYRNDRKKERAALQEIAWDLTADSADLAIMHRRMTLQDQAAIWCVTHLQEEVPPDSAVQKLTPLFRYTLYQPVRSAYVGLRDSGELTLISDPLLRRAIVEYYEMRQQYVLQHDEDYWPVRMRFFDLVWGDVLMVPDSGATSFWQTSRLEMRTPWRDFARDPEFRSAVTLFGTYSSQFAERISGVLADNHELLVAIGTALGEVEIDEDAR